MITSILGKRITCDPRQPCFVVRFNEGGIVSRRVSDGSVGADGNITYTWEPLTESGVVYYTGETFKIKGDIYNVYRKKGEQSFKCPWERDEVIISMAPVSTKDGGPDILCAYFVTKPEVYVDVQCNGQNYRINAALRDYVTATCNAPEGYLIYGYSGGSSGCHTTNHRSYGACVKSASVTVGPLYTSTGISFETTRNKCSSPHDNKYNGSEDDRNNYDEPTNEDPDEPDQQQAESKPQEPLSPTDITTNKPYNISITATTGGIITPGVGLYPVDAGSKFTVSAEASDDNVIKSVIIDSVQQQCTNTFEHTFTNIQANHTVVITFLIEEEPVTGGSTVVWAIQEEEP